MNYNLEEMATFGVAGNFTGHLEQAGEAKDFTNIKTIAYQAFQQSMCFCLSELL